MLDRRFPKDIAQSPLPKLLDFGRGKCIPCKKMAPILKELSEEYKDRVIIKIIEIDQEPGLTDGKPDSSHPDPNILRCKKSGSSQA